MYEQPLFLPAGDQALVVELGDDISPETNRKVHTLAQAIEEQGISEVVDLLPTYRSLLVQYDPMRISQPDLETRLLQIESMLDEKAQEKPNIIHIPTLYGGDYGPDLPFVAEQAGLTPDEVLALHSGTDYLVYMIGFTPGFPYLGGLPEALSTPRLDTPRTSIPAGSVGIAEGQTGIYPIVSPGGWRLIGRTPLKLFDPLKEPPSLLAAGDYARFVPLEEEKEYLQVRDQVERGEYRVAATRMK